MAVISTSERSSGGAGPRSRAATRSRLRSAAKALFADRGLHGVTSHDIARGAGVASGTFYLHFRDKQELFREIIDETVTALRSRLTGAVEEIADPEERVRAHSRAMVDFASEHRDLMRILFSGDAEAAAVEHDVLESLAASVAEGRRKRSDPQAPPSALEPAVLSQALVGMWARVIAWWSADPARASAESIVDTLAGIQLSGTDPR